MNITMEQDPGISDKKLEANRRNSLKSTGPRSDEGKARSAMNALKHGLTAEQIVLPNEDPEAYDALRQKWLDDYPDADAGQLALIEIAVRNIWMLDRAARHKRAMSAERMRHARTCVRPGCAFSLRGGPQLHAARRAARKISGYARHARVRARRAGARQCPRS